MKKLTNKGLLTEAQRIANIVNDKIIIFHQGGYRFIPHKNIIRFESDNSYTKVILLNNDSFLVSKSISKYEEELNGSFFLRVHQSHIINLDQVKTYYRHPPAYLILNNNDKIPVSREQNRIFSALIYQMR